MSEPHTSGTALRECVYSVYACGHSVNLNAHLNISREIERPHTARVQH